MKRIRIEVGPEVFKKLEELFGKVQPTGFLAIRSEEDDVQFFPMNEEGAKEFIDLLGEGTEAWFIPVGKEAMKESMGLAGQGIEICFVRMNTEEFMALFEETQREQE